MEGKCAEGRGEGTICGEMGVQKGERLAREDPGWLQGEAWWPPGTG